MLIFVQQTDPTVQQSAWECFLLFLLSQEKKKQTNKFKLLDAGFRCPALSVAREQKDRLRA